MSELKRGFRYIRTPHGSLAIAYEFCEELGNRLYDVGIAFCSPKDQFSKAKGRMIAERRLAKKRVDGSSGGFFRFLDVSKAENGVEFKYPNIVVEDMIMVTYANMDSPRWLSRALNHYRAGLEREKAA